MANPAIEPFGSSFNAAQPTLSPLVETASAAPLPKKIDLLKQQIPPIIQLHWWRGDMDEDCSS